MIKGVPLPLLGVAHGLEVLLDFLHLLVLSRRDLEPIDSLQQVDLLIQRLLQRAFSLFLSEGLIVLDLLQLGYSPDLPRSSSTSSSW